ncbi:MAG: hypothetical protein ACXWDL_08195 [Nocardioides sp.]
MAPVFTRLRAENGETAAHLPFQGAEMNDSSTAPRTAVSAAWAAALLFGVVAAFHVAIVLGAPWGEYTQGGGTTGALDTSGRAVAAVSCVISAAMAAAILGRVGRGPLRRFPPRVTTVLVWFTTAYAVIGVILNLITRSAAERALWAPVSIVLLGLVAFVMVTTNRKPVQSNEGPSAHARSTDR